MPHISIRTFHRDDLIRLGQVVAEWIKENPTELPHVITLDGWSNSGKSLLALAVDAVLDPDPDLYPTGTDRIPTHYSADDVLSPMLRYFGTKRTVFTNYHSLLLSDKTRFDLELDETRQHYNYKTAQAFFVSNLRRVREGSFDYARDGLDSDILSANFNFRAIRLNIGGHYSYKHFERKIMITARDQSLVDKIKQACFSKFSAPHPPAYGL